MQTIYPYQLHFLVAELTRFADFLEAEENPDWFALGSAAACLEYLLQGNTPADIDAVSQRLKALGVADAGPRLCGRNYYTVVTIAQTIIDGHRLGLLFIQPEIRQPRRWPVWIGIDMATGPDRSVFGWPRHA